MEVQRLWDIIFTLLREKPTLRLELIIKQAIAQGKDQKRAALENQAVNLLLSSFQCF